MPRKISIFRQIMSRAACIGIILLAQGCEKSKNPDSYGANKPISAQDASQNLRAKNVILFIGDGMGVSTITAARIFDGQAQGKLGEEHALAFEDFEHLALIKTYNTNAQVPDSAGTATAMLSGYKTNIGAVNVRPSTNVKKMVFESCIRKNSPPSLTKRLKKAGLSVGIISTARITHATPAAMYGHAVDRGWESAVDVRESAAKAGCKDLATQMIKNPADITLGGGAGKFSQALIDEWRKKDGHIYVKDAGGLRAAPKDKQILGLFTDSHMSYEADRDNAKEPSLAEMTAFTIDALSARGTGYIIMIEAGRVDHAHHGTNAYRALRDMQALNEAVKVAKDKTGDDTLIMVTADHSHVFTMAGYPARGNPILGLVKNPDPEAGTPKTEPALARDGKPYTTLGYHNGPNVREADSPPLSDNMVQAQDFLQQTAVDMNSETHAGEDVPLYARGPGAQRVRGVMEQDEIHGVIMSALGLEPYKK
jgi:alkaline phosphatase